ncbi:MAG: CoA transferase [Burkholderiaceae bacterium]|nr:CoA transferase [Burkholderiaceae bacterium]
MTTEALPFEGLKVIDCASYIAGPAAATMLSDFGADVVKVEPPEGDPLRGLYRLPGAPPAELNYAWDLDSRNKRSLVLDLKAPAGQAVLHRLVAQADVFITNLPLAVRRRLALNHEALLPPNPRLVYASLTAYGETGPEAGKAGFDVTAYWARSGLMDLVRADASAAPSRPVAGMGDHPSAVTLFAAITTALYRRERSGRGGLVGTSLLANGLWSNSIQVQATLSGVRYPPRPPRERAPNALNNIYRCRDGRWLNLIVLNEARQWTALLQVLGCAELADDERFATSALREAHSAQLVRLFDRRFAGHDLAHWRPRLDAAGITFGLIGTLDDIPDDAQMREAGVLVSSDHGPGRTVANPVQLGGVAQRRPGAPPALGQHSREVLQQAGYDAGQIDGLLAQRIVVAAPATDPTLPADPA